MILHNQFAPRVPTRSRFAIALFAGLLFVEATRVQAGADAQDAAPAKPADRAIASTTSQFPFAVPFEQGATRLLNGDQITILEVRGTADRFAQGHIYWIRGTYSLASRDRAALAAYTTAMDAENARSISYQAQMTIVDRGTGTFTLFLPMSCRGWPHVSFYPADGGASFGGNYFGTGDSVLKRWWGSNDKD